MSRLFYIFIFILMFLLDSCHSLSDNDEDYAGTSEGGKNYHHQNGSGTTDEGNVPNDNKKEFRLPTQAEFQQLFAFPFAINGSLILFETSEGYLSFPFCGYSIGERQVVLQGVLASYLTAERTAFRITQEGTYSVIALDGSFHSLRMVSDKAHEGLVKVGNVYWKSANEGENPDETFYFNEELNMIAYK